MSTNRARRIFLGAGGAAAAGSLLKQAPAQDASGAKRAKIIGVSCSPRKNKTTAAALRACLEAANAVGPHVETELVELGGMAISGDIAAGLPLAEGRPDDFPAIEANVSKDELGLATARGLGRRVAEVATLLRNAAV